MMQNHDYELEALRREHMMQYAQEQQRATNLLSGQTNIPANRGVISPTLASMGRMLSNIGDNLQQRYGDLPSTTINASFQTETA
ncbi:MAG: hypothetical protein RLP44_31100 [Aggregatilineales bacterium]